MAQTATMIRTSLLTAIHAALGTMDGVLADPRLSGIQITLKLNGHGTVRTVIVEPELRFEST